MQKLIAILVLSLLCSNTAICQSEKTIAKTEHTPFILGLTDELQSAQLSEKRTLNIYLPEHYGKDTAHYPVIYLLDGSANEDFVHIVGLVQFLNMIEVVPPTIVVGIANTDRRRDFTFPTTIDSDRVAYPTTGGSAKFISFMEKELLPYVARNYRTTGTTTLIGQSLGGLLATEVLFRKASLFSNYVIISPSLWWDAESLLAKENLLQLPPPAGETKVYIAMGSEGKIMEGDARKLNDILTGKKLPNLKVHLNPMPEENHLTILHNAAYKALSWLNAKP